MANGDSKKQNDKYLATSGIVPFTTPSSAADIDNDDDGGNGGNGNPYGGYYGGSSGGLTPIAATGIADQAVNQNAIYANQAGDLERQAQNALKDYDDALAFNQAVYDQDMALAQAAVGADWYDQQRKLQRTMQQLNNKQQGYGSGTNTLDFLSNSANDIQNWKLLHTYQTNQQSAIDSLNSANKQATDTYNANINQYLSNINQIENNMVAQTDAIYKAMNPGEKAPKRSDFNSDQEYQYAMEAWRNYTNNPYARMIKGVPTVDSARIWKALGLSGAPNVGERRTYEALGPAMYGRQAYNITEPNVESNGFRNQYEAIRSNRGRY